MTLAVFEDSGWYKVNYNNADTYLWGRRKLLYKIMFCVIFKPK